MPVAYQGVNRFSNAVALLGSGRVLALRQIADALIETGFVTGSRHGDRNPEAEAGERSLDACAFIGTNPPESSIGLTHEPSAEAKIPDFLSMSRPQNYPIS